MPRKTDAKSNSKILKCIVSSLEKGKFKHVLKWINRREKEFSILFVHKSYPKWHESYLDLFKELDGLSKKKCEQYLQKQDYESACKVRCKSNLSKLCTDGVLSKRWKKNENKSKFLVCYKINDSSGIQVPLLKEPEMQEKLTHDLTASHRTVAVQKTIEDHLINEQLNSSDFPCLSNQSLMSFQDSGGNCSSYNLQNPKYMDGGRDLPYQNWIEASLGSTDRLMNHKNVESNFEIKNGVPEEELSYGKVKAIWDSTENYGSTESLFHPSVQNDHFGINKELSYEKVKAICDSTENYGLTELLFYPNVQNDEFDIKKVNCMPLNGMNFDPNAVPNRLAGVENSFDLNFINLSLIAKRAKFK